jgi:hypothetical protein
MKELLLDDSWLSTSIQYCGKSDPPARLWRNRIDAGSFSVDRVAVDVRPDNWDESHHHLSSWFVAR